MRIRFVLALFIVIASVAYAQQVPGVVIDHQDASTGQYIGSPSIVIAPNGNYIATHDLFGPGASSTTLAESKVFVSEDRGASWKQIASFQEQFWSNLFVVKGRIYLMGSSAEYGRIVIRTSEDNGRSWSSAHYLTDGPGFHTAPVPVVIHEGRIYRAFEYHPTGPWGSFRAFLMWASIDSDLTSASSWSFSDRQSFPVGEFGNTWLEGNAVVAPDGSILDILRVNNSQHAAILKLTGTNLKLDRFVDFPGGATKFSIRFDAVSKLYWALVNPALPGEASSLSSPGSVRNTLALMSSPDLTHWTPRSIVLHHPDVLFHAFQYVDWQFDGNDLIVASRTAFDDAAGGANSFHDANYLTFHRIREFRRLGTVKLAGSHFTNAEAVSATQIGKWATASTTDATKSANGAVLWERPLIASNSGNLLDSIIGGWEITAVFADWTRLPFTPTISGDRVNTSVTVQLPDRIASGTLANPRAAKWFDTSAFPPPPNCASTSVGCRYGNAGRNILRADSLADVDATPKKNLKFTECLGMKLRLEAFNLANHPTLAKPNSVNAVVSSTLNANRTMQAAVKLYF